jgi:hypothetical protein
MVLAVVHEVSRHDNLLLHHVSKGECGTVGVLLIHSIHDLQHNNEHGK